MDNLVRIQYRPHGENFTKEQFKRFSNDVVGEQGKAFAMSISDIFAKWLSPGYKELHPVPIGASGKASRSFRAVKGAGRSGFTSYDVVEGSESAARVRVGIPPGQPVSLGALKLWAGRKGIELLSSKDYNKKRGAAPGLYTDKDWTFGKAIAIESYTQKSGKKIDAFGKSSPGKKGLVNSALKAIQNALIEGGTERPGANWMNYFPGEKGHFDYPRYLFTARKNVVTDLEAHHQQSIAVALVSFMNSGGRVQVRDFKTSRLRKPAKYSGLF